ncbi:precorrin-4 C(11)-methyltransferase [Swingsia samuiensis]|uniref:Precorrin-4 C(11)-methyltransferase n=1 Tax=Swingsia samuiensis TaxID=1293412 RepID=A0A4Y6UMY8_9PROT|nr:precorrin-4 C(11)-methyltransferase [Swingsia samuiensis]QDH17756.1 precorrin-4 C(11)-methyltransferase [Swingsia samuiensis]
MTVHFVGAGPGAADLLTLRGRDILASCPVCLYAGSIIPQDILKHCPENARLVNTAALSLDEIEQEYIQAHAENLDVARLHSGDLAIYSAVAEQVRRLDRLGIPWTMTPGVPSFSAAASVLGNELTVPEVAQTVVLTRMSGRASSMPPKETLAAYAATGCTLVIHLAIHALDRIVEELLPFYGSECAAAIVARAEWPDEIVIRSTLGVLLDEVKHNPIERTALVLVGPALHAQDFRESALYNPEYQRRFRS